MEKDCNATEMAPWLSQSYQRSTWGGWSEGRARTSTPLPCPPPATFSTKDTGAPTPACHHRLAIVSGAWLSSVGLVKDRRRGTISPRRAEMKSTNLVCRFVLGFSVCSRALLFHSTSQSCSPARQLWPNHAGLQNAMKQTIGSFLPVCMSLSHGAQCPRHVSEA